MKTFKALILIMIAATLAACSGGLGDAYDALRQELEPVKVLNLRAAALDQGARLSWELITERADEYSGMRVRCMKNDVNYDGTRDLIAEQTFIDSLPSVHEFDSLENGVAYIFEVTLYRGAVTDEYAISGSTTSIVFTPAIYVKQDAAPAVGATVGSSWDNAFNTLEDALAVADARATASTPQVIWVAAGKYTPLNTTDASATFTIPAYTSVYGGFQANEEALSHRYVEIYELTTSLSGAPLGARAEHCTHVVTVEPDAAGVLLDGFIIEDGKADGASAATARGAGLVTVGAAVDSNADVEIYNCMFRNNTAASSTSGLGQGGAIYAENSELDIGNSIFTENSASSEGGAISVNMNTAPPLRTIISGTRFENNQAVNAETGATAGTGGAICYASINGSTRTVSIGYCTFIGNKSWRGGACALATAASTTLSDVMVYNTFFLRNIVEGGRVAEGLEGGALYLINVEGDLVNCLIAEGSAANGAGCYFGANDTGVSRIINIVNNTIVDNDALRGGGMYLMGEGYTVNFNNSIMYRCTASVEGHYIYADYPDAASNVINLNTYAMVGLRNTPGGSLDSALLGTQGYIECFFNPYGAYHSISDAELNAGYQLVASSPLIDAGVDALYTYSPGGSGITTEVFGNNRFRGTIDIGAHEFPK